MSYYGSYRLGQAGGEFTHTHAHEKFVTSYILGPLGIVVKLNLKSMARKPEMGTASLWGSSRSDYHRG
jgi:hypothetical protein